MTACLALFLTACGSAGASKTGGSGGAATASSSSGSSAKSSSGGTKTASSGGAHCPVQLAVLAPFSGPSAQFGQADYPGAQAAVAAMNAAGGVLGCKVQLIKQDLGADPTDAVNNTNQLLARYPNLSGIVGMTSDSAVPVAKILDQAKVTAMGIAGTIQMDHLKLPYIYRILAPDSVESTAMAADALLQGYTRAAVMADEDQGAQSIVPPIVAAYTAHGGKIVINEKIPVDQSSYRTEITKMLATHPQVIFGEWDPQTGATLFSELKQMHGLTIPVIGSDPTLEKPWTSAVAKAVGGYAQLGKFMESLNSASSQGVGWNTFVKHYHKFKSGQATSSIGAYYDVLTIEAIAMDLAKSTKPSVYNAKIIPDVLNDSSAPNVSSYAAALKAIKGGATKVWYGGAVGHVHMNQYHWPYGNFTVQKVQPNGNLKVIRTITKAQVAKYEPAGN